ncbi:MAG: hypothetical protein WCP85_05595 [Mariniphaga sp.]
METLRQDISDNDFIIIPNPIYDVVFRYLMEDPDSAMIVVSTLINENIIKLHLEPITHSEKKEKPGTTSLKDFKLQDEIRLFHLDFTATVQLPDGTEELIMIELQKASEPDDISRFKRYISKNFQKKQEIEITDPVTQAIKTVQKPMRLVPVFILNFRIENEINDLLIKTDRIKNGIYKNMSLQKHNEFIDNLTYDILVIQLPNIGNINEDDYRDDEYKSKLFALLKLFDQKSRIKDNEHRLRLIRKFFPGFLERVVRRLQSADIDNPYLEEKMYEEDEYLKVLADRDNQISFLQDKYEKTFEQLDIERKLNQEKDLELDSKAIKIKHLQLALAKKLIESGMSIDRISLETGLPTDEIGKL